MHVRTYLDNAATSFPKPPSVVEAVTQFLTENGCAAGRGGYRDAVTASKLVDQTRTNLARLLNATSPRQFAFAYNGTDALNQLIHGFVRPGDRVVTTTVEHNSVLRPLSALASKANIQVQHVPCDPTGFVAPEAISQSLKQAPTQLLVINHASNVTGTVQPLEELVPLAHAQGVPVLVDAAQTLGHVPLDLQAVPIDMLAAPGHKGLLGPLGTGLLYVSPQVEHLVRPTRQGGTGTASQRESQPADMPERMEAGNLNLPGIAGLNAGIAFVLDQGVSRLAEHHRRLRSDLRCGLESLDGARLVGPHDDDRAVGVISLVLDDFDPLELAAMLDACHGIQVRAGLHCAARIHRCLNTYDGGGTVRFSVGATTTSDDIQRAIAALQAIVTTRI